jgi:hypothetical protein
VHHDVALEGYILPRNVLVFIIIDKSTPTASAIRSNHGAASAKPVASLTQFAAACKSRTGSMGVASKTHGCFFPENGGHLVACSALTR